MSDGAVGGRCAVLVIDLQNDFVHPQGAFAAMGRDVSPGHGTIDVVNAVTAAARAAGALVVLTAQTATEATTSAARRRMGERRGWPPGAVCAAGSWGAQLEGTVHVEATDLVLEKPRYSAFVGTALDVILRSQAVDTVLVAGVETNVCVDTTVRDAYMRDYHVVVVRDAVACTDAELGAATLRTLALHFCAVVDAGQIVDEFRARTCERAVGV